MSLLLIKGTRESAGVNAVIVTLKVAVVLIFIFLGWQYINNDNYTHTFHQTKECLDNSVLAEL